MSFDAIKSTGTTSRDFSTKQAHEDASPTDATVTVKYNISSKTGAYTFGENISFVGSGATGRIVEDIGSTCVIETLTGTPAVSDTITGDTSTQTSNLDSVADSSGCIWKSESYDDSTFTGGLVVSGQTTSSTAYLEYTTATGESMFDDTANALVYDATKGVSVNITWSDTTLQFSLATRYTRMSKIQFKFTNTSTGSYSGRGISVGRDSRFCDSIIEANMASGAVTAFVIETSSYYGNDDAISYNLLVVMTRDSATNNAMQAFYTYGGHLINCGAVAPSGLTNPGTGLAFQVNGYQSSTIIKNSYAFNLGGFNSGTYETGSDYNASDDTSSPGVNSQDSLTFANQFVSTTNTNWKLKSGADLIDGGNTDASYPDDIFGTARGTTTSGDVGPHEFVAAAAGNPWYYYAQH